LLASVTDDYAAKSHAATKYLELILNGTLSPLKMFYSFYYFSGRKISLGVGINSKRDTFSVEDVLFILLLLRQENLSGVGTNNKHLCYEVR
jgi:hypothetical protein